MNIVLLLLYLMMLAGAFVFPQSKKLAVLLFSLFCFIFAFGHFHGDYQIYQWIYSEFNTGLYNTEFEPLFSLTFWIATKIRLPFVAYRLIVGLFICSQMYRLIVRHTSCVALSAALYGCFPFFMYTAVIRSGVASVFVLIAIEQLMTPTPDRKRFVFFIVLATLFHYSSFFFIFLLIIDERIKQSTVLIILFISMALAIVLNYTPIPYKIVSLLTSRQKTLQWFMKSDDATANINGIIGILFLIVSMYAMTRYNLSISTISSAESDCDYFSCCQISLEMHYNGVVEEVEANESSFVSEYYEASVSHRLSIMMILFAPLMILASPFTRLPFMVFIFVIITTINTGMKAQMLYSEDGFRPGRVSLSWVLLLFVSLLWKVYFDLPYLKEGSRFFWEYLDVRFL